MRSEWWHQRGRLPTRAAGRDRAPVDQRPRGLEYGRPVWNQTFELALARPRGVTSVMLSGSRAREDREAGLRLHVSPKGGSTNRLPRARAMSFSEEPSAQIEVKLANVFLLGNAAPNNARKGIVGWFPLVPKDVGGSRLTGELKLRFHLKRAHLLEGLDEACRQELIAHPAAYIRVLNRHTSYEPAAW